MVRLTRGFSSPEGKGDSVHFTEGTLLLATLGTEPQVVTAATDLLRRQGMKLAEAQVFHSVAEPGSPIAQAVERLRQEFDQPGSLPLRLLPLADPSGRPLADVQSPPDIEAAFRFLYRQVRLLKQQGWRLHLCLAGGRKPLALFSLAVAQLLGEAEDRLWYLHSTPDFLSSKRLHPEPGEAELIPIPYILWNRLAPAWLTLPEADDPYAAVERVRELQLAERLEQARSFVLGALTPAERRTVLLLVRDGLDDQALGEQLGVSPRTVESQLRAAYQKAANHWDLPDVSRTQLVALLHVYTLMQPPAG